MSEPPFGEFASFLLSKDLFSSFSPPPLRNADQAFVLQLLTHVWFNCFCSLPCHHAPQARLCRPGSAGRGRSWCYDSQASSHYWPTRTHTASQQPSSSQRAEGWELEGCLFKPLQEEKQSLKGNKASVSPGSFLYILSDFIQYWIYWRREKRLSNSQNSIENWKIPKKKKRTKLWSCTKKSLVLVLVVVPAQFYFTREMLQRCDVWGDQGTSHLKSCWLLLVQFPPLQWEWVTERAPTTTSTLITRHQHL